MPCRIRIPALGVNVMAHIFGLIFLVSGSVFSQAIGYGISAYYDLDDLRADQNRKNEEARLLGHKEPYSSFLPDVGVMPGYDLLKEQHLNTLRLFPEKGFLKVADRGMEDAQAKTLKKNIQIAMTLSSAVKNRDLVSENQLRRIFFKYHVAKTGKHINDVSKESLRDTLRALLADDFRIYKKQMEALPFWARKSVGYVTLDELIEDAKRQANIPSFRAGHGYPATPLGRKQMLQDNLRARGYSEVYIFFDSLFNPAYRGTGNLDDMLKAMGGFAPQAPAAPEPIASPIRFSPPSTHY